MYSLFALVGQDLERDVAADERAKVVDLTDGYQLVHLARPQDTADEELTIGSYLLSPALLDRLRSTFRGPPGRAVLEAEFWAGVGYQFATAWSDDGDLLVPTTTSNDPSPDDPPGGPWPDPPIEAWAINRALAALGVDPAGSGASDPFEHLGLDRRPLPGSDDGTGPLPVRWAD